MKHLLFAMLMLPLLAGAQSQKDHENALARFQNFYNHDQADSINNMWPADMRSRMPRPMWEHKEQDELKKQYGKFLSFEYAGIDNADPDKVRLFYVKFEHSTHMLSMTVDKAHMLGDFRLQTSNRYIDSVFRKMQKAKKPAKRYPT